MPWHKKAMKGVVSCDKPREVANRCRSGDTRIGKPAESNISASISEYIGNRGDTRGTETSKYPEEKKENSIP